MLWTGFFLMSVYSQLLLSVLILPILLLEHTHTHTLMQSLSVYSFPQLYHLLLSLTHLFFYLSVYKIEMSIIAIIANKWSGGIFFSLGLPPVLMFSNKFIYLCEE